MKNEFTRWVHLIHLTEEMSQLRRERNLSLGHLRKYLGSVEEAFADRKDPFAEFPAFSLVRFCQELSACLAELPANQIGAQGVGRQDQNHELSFTEEDL